MNEQAKELAAALLRTIAESVEWETGADDATEEANATRAMVAAAKGALAAAKVIYPDATPEGGEV